MKLDGFVRALPRLALLLIVACQHTAFAQEAAVDAAPVLTPVGTTYPYAQQLQWLDEGRFGGVLALAAHVCQDRSYVAKVLGLTLLAPDVATAISLGQQPSACTLSRLLRGLPARWEEQRKILGFPP